MEKALMEQQLRVLRIRANGVDENGRPVPFEVQQAALSALHKLDREAKLDEERAAAAAEERRRIDMAHAEAQRQAKAREEIDRHSIANNFEIKHRELDLEEQKVRIAQAEVVVRMLEVARSSDLGVREALLTLTDMGLVPENRRLAVAPDAQASGSSHLAEAPEDDTSGQ